MPEIKCSIRESFHFPLELSLFEDSASASFTLCMASPGFYNYPDFSRTHPDDDDTIPRRYVTIPTIQGSEIFSLIQNLVLPAFPPFTCGMDGTAYEILFNNMQASVRWEWWGTPPESWIALGNLIDQMLSLARKHGLPPLKRLRENKG